MLSSRSRAVVILGLLLGVLATVPASALAGPRILGGPRVDVTAAPYVASLLLADQAGDPTGRCTGAIIDARRVLTSAHCFDTPGELASGGNVRVGSNAGQPLPLDAGGQSKSIASVRVHPGHIPSGSQVQRDDIAVVTLDSDIAFGPRAQPIAMVAPSAYPATGAAVVQSGYGRESIDVESDGYLHARFATVATPDDCGPDNAVEVCFSDPTTAECPGDSGGPIVVGGVLVGVNSGGDCSAGGTGVAASLAAPELRTFVDGSATPPVAPVGVTYPTIYGVPQVGRTLTCSTGGWANAASYAYGFEDARDGTSLQVGPSPTRVLVASDLGRPIRCNVAALSPGGLGQAHTGTTPPVEAAPPPVTTTTGSTATTTVPGTESAPRGPSVSLSLSSTVRRRTRQSLRVSLRAGSVALPSTTICVSVSSRARLVHSHGKLRARTKSCRTYSSQAANSTRTLSLRVRATSRGTVRVRALVTPTGLTPLVATRTVRSR